MEKTALTVTIERSEYESMGRENAKLKVLVEYYKHQFLLSKRRQFGSSSEVLEEKSGQLICSETRRPRHCRSPM